MPPSMTPNKQKNQLLLLVESTSFLCSSFCRCNLSMKFSPLELLLVISIAVIVGIVLVVLVKYLIRYAIKFLRKN